MDFPVFPDPTGNVSYNEETDSVSMSLDYYERIYEYKLRVDEAESVYLKLKELYEAEE